MEQHKLLLLQGNELIKNKIFFANQIKEAYITQNNI